jgi:hypothetical protein
MFMGTIYNSIDLKNRMIVPSRFRNELGRSCVLTRGLDRCLYIYTMEDKKGDTTLSFEDIELFGMLTKTHKDGLIAASTSLANRDGIWYWRSETIDETAEGWPEFVVALPESITDQLQA